MNELNTLTNLLIADFQQLDPGKLQNQNDEVFDDEYMGRKSDIEYSFYHYTELDAIQGLSYIRDLFAIGYDYCKPLFKEQGVRPGHLVIRVLEYKQLKPFGAHQDISFCTKVLSSPDSKVMYGTQAALINPRVKPMPHKFNGSSSQYSIVMFANAHFSTKLHKGGTIGDYLNKIYYHS